MCSGRVFLKMERCGGDRGKFSGTDDAAQGAEQKMDRASLENARTSVRFWIRRPNGASKESLKVPPPPPLTSTPVLPKALSVNAPQLSILVHISSKNATIVFLYSSINICTHI